MHRFISVGHKPITPLFAISYRNIASSNFFKLSILLIILIFSGFGGGVKGQTLTVGSVTPSSPTAPNAGGGSCGVFEKPNFFPESYGGDHYYDRFGNLWTADEITELSANVTEEVTAGVFRLSFSGFYTPEERNTVRDVFNYLSGEVGGTAPLGVVPLKIEFTSLPSGVGGQASLFSELDCGILRNMPLGNIRTQTNPYPPGFYTGLIQISESINWYTGTNVPDLNTWNTDPLCVGKIDLYTVVLHEALHTLGFASTYGGVELMDGSVVQDVYTEYDKFLYKKTGNAVPQSQLQNYSQLIVPANDPTCCSKHIKNTSAVPGFGTGCGDEIFFGEPNGINFAAFAEVSYSSLNPDPAIIGEINNKLSHLDIDCNPGNPALVMHPGVPSSPQQYSYPRREITTIEKDILNKIGYSISSCVTQLGDDVIPVTLFLSGGVNTFTAYIGNIGLAYSLSENDFLYGNDFNFYFQIVSPIPAGLEITPNMDGQNTISINIKALQAGTWTFQYRYLRPNCGEFTCDVATVTVRVLERPIFQDCNPNDCNLTCYGDAEKFESKLGSEYIQNLGFPQPPNLFNISQNTPDIFTQIDANNNQIFSFFSGNSSVSPPSQINFESLLLPLSQPISPGCTATVKFKSTSHTIYSAPNAPKLVFLGLTDYNDCYTLEFPNCNNPMGTISCQNSPNSQDKSFCLGSKNISFDDNAILALISNLPTVDNLNLQPEEFVFTNTFNAPIKYLIVYGSFDGYDPTIPNLGYEVVFFMDDIEVTQNCVNQLQITPTVISACIGDKAIVQYEVCLSGVGTLPQTITLDIDPPFGFTLLPNADFNSNGTATFQLTPELNCNGGANVKIVTLEMEVSPNFDPAQAPIPVNLPLNVSGIGLCSDPATGFGGNTTLMLNDCTAEPITCDCPPGITPFPIGNNSGAVTSLKITNLESKLSDQCIKINGILNVDKDWKLYNCSVIMGNGASIVVTDNKKFEIAQNTILKGCQKMWKGITINSGSQFIADGKSGEVSILDAQYAVQPKSGSTISISYTKFDKNYVGIYTAPSTATQSITTTLLTTNKFLCSNDLLPNYTGQLPVAGNRSYAMAELNRTVGIDFKNNTADGLTNGLLADRSTFSMEQCTIKNLVNTASYPVQNTGVYATQCASVILDHNTFERNGTSVLSFESNLEAVFNVITNTTNTNSDFFYGIVVKNAAGKSTAIKDNIIKTWGPGIKVSDALAPLTLNVRRNFIYQNMTAQGIPSVPLASIDLDRCEKGLIYDNKMYNQTNLGNGEGLKMNGCSSNNIARNEAYSFRNGYQVDGGATNYFYHNISQSQQGDNRVGFEVWNSLNTYCLNTTEKQTQEGWLFSGACNPSQLNCNTIGNAQYGLYLASLGTGDETEIGLQIKKGNQWTGTYEEWGAYHASTDDIVVDLSKFRMPTAQIPTWETASGSTDWFATATGSTNCTTICPSPSDVEFSGGGGDNVSGDSDTDIRTVQGEHTGAGMNWMAQQRLFERLKFSESSMADGTLQTFYDNAESSAIGQLSQLRHKTYAVLARSAAQQQYMLAIQEQIQTLSAKLATLRDNGPTNGKEIDWRNQMGIQQGILMQKMAFWYGYENGLKTAYHTQLPALLSENKTISTPNGFAKNEKTLNALRLKNQYITGVVPVDNAVLEAVKSIADQCPMEGGFAVYEARTAYRNYFPQQTWDDRALCGFNVGLRSTPSASSISHSFWVQPNPANEAVVFYADQRPPTQTRVNLYGFTGALVATQVFADDMLTLDTHQLPAGMYYYRIQSESGIIQSGKLIIAH